MWARFIYIVYLVAIGIAMFGWAWLMFAGAKRLL
jgi:hypothetical protein